MGQLRLQPVEERIGRLAEEQGGNNEPDHHERKDCELPALLGARRLQKLGQLLAVETRGFQSFLGDLSFLGCSR